MPLRYGYGVSNLLISTVNIHRMKCMSPNCIARGHHILGCMCNNVGFRSFTTVVKDLLYVGTCLPKEGRRVISCESPWVAVSNRMIAKSFPVHIFDFAGNFEWLAHSAPSENEPRISTRELSGSVKFLSAHSLSACDQ
jgi:hypothetical protein